MSASALEIAARLLRGNKAADEQTIQGLAACLNHGFGAVRIGATERGLLVLEPLQAAKYFSHPPIIAIHAPLSPPAHVSTQNMVHTFKQEMYRTNAITSRPPAPKPTWLPIPPQSYLTTTGGAFGELRYPRAERLEFGQTKWYLPASPLCCPIGSTIWRMGRLRRPTAYQRIGINAWMKLKCPALSRSGVDVLEGVRDFEEFEPSAAPLPTLYSPVI